MASLPPDASEMFSDGYAEIESVETTKGHQILKPMKVDFPEGAICAILGPSGSGKTTFLNTVTNNIQSNIKAYGNIQLPGSQAFVPQDDRLHGFYTCRSYLRHYARLSGMRLTADLEQEIDYLLKELGLAEQAGTIVGDVFLKGLSGGQKRRLSVALEALTRPQNIFLDEPTSGLDAESAYQVMEFLKEYVRKSPGRRVILTIHQPSSHIWRIIDHTVLLSKGRLIYQGPRQYMEDFFVHCGYPTPASFNPADHYVMAVNDEFRLHELSVDEWADKFEHYKGAHPASTKTGRTASMVQSVQREKIMTSRSASPKVAFELVYRYFMNLWFNPGILGTRVVMYSMLALMVGVLFWGLGDRTDFQSVQSRSAVLFYCVAFFVFMSVAVLPFTVIERAIVDKEIRNGYYVPSMYQFAQAVASLPGTALLAGLTTLIIILMTKLNDPLWYFLNMFLSLTCAEALAMLVSHWVPHFVIGMALIAGMYGFFMLFMGFMIIPSDFPVWLRWTYNIAFHTYSWRSFMYGEFCCEDDVEFEGPYTTGKEILEAFEIGDVNRGRDMIVLLGYALVIHAMSLVVLYLRYYTFRGKLEKPKNATPRREKRAVVLEEVKEERLDATYLAGQPNVLRNSMSIEIEA